MCEWLQTTLTENLESVNQPLYFLAEIACRSYRLFFSELAVVGGGGGGGGVGAGGGNWKKCEQGGQVISLEHRSL